MVLWTAALFLIVEPIAGQVVEPLVYGHSAGLSPVAVIVFGYILDVALGSNWPDLGNAIDDLSGCFRPPRGSAEISGHHVWR